MKKKTAVKKATSSKTKSRRPTGAKSTEKKKAPAKRAAAKPARAEVAPAARPSKNERSKRDSREAAEAAIEAALDKKGLMPVLLDVSDQASYTDFIGIISGRSDRQVDAIAENVSRAMADRGRRLIGREGNGNGRWTLLDFGDVVLHVFYHPVRELYDIESLWSDAPRVKLTVPPEAQLYQPDALYGTP